MNNSNERMNIILPSRQQQKQYNNDQTPLIIGLGFLSIMLFGMVVALLVAVKI
jgi:hypothetical protein